MDTCIVNYGYMGNCMAQVLGHGLREACFACLESSVELRSSLGCVGRVGARRSGNILGPETGYPCLGVPWMVEAGGVAGVCPTMSMRQTLSQYPLSGSLSYVGRQKPNWRGGWEGARKQENGESGMGLSGLFFGEGWAWWLRSGRADLRAIGPRGITLFPWKGKGGSTRRRRGRR